MSNRMNQYKLDIDTLGWREVYVDANDEQEARQLVESWNGVLCINSLTEVQPGDYDWRTEENPIEQLKERIRQQKQQKKEVTI